MGSEPSGGWLGEVQLRPVQDGDLSIFFAQQLDEVANHQAAFTSGDPANRPNFDAHWRRIQSDSGIMIRTVVWDGAVVGHIASYPHGEDLEVTYWLGREHWGRGIATRALMHFVRLLGTRPLFGRAASDNLASIRVLEKCGFIRVGQDRGFANARGEEIDEVVLALEDTDITRSERE